MLWVFIFSLLPDLDQECPPLPCGLLDLLLPRVSFWPSPWPFGLDLQQVLKWFLLQHCAPHWALTSWVGLGTLAACLTGTTSTFVAIVVPECEGLDLINGSCRCYSTSGLVLIEVFHHAFMVLGMFKRRFTAFLLLPYPSPNIEGFGCMKSSSV